MRVVTRIALVLSAVVVLGAISLFVSSVDDLSEYGGEDTGIVGLLYAVLVGALYSLIPVAFIWLGVFVVYMAIMAGRVVER